MTIENLLVQNRQVRKELTKRRRTEETKLAKLTNNPRNEKVCAQSKTLLAHFENEMTKALVQLSQLMSQKKG